MRNFMVKAIKLVMSELESNKKIFLSELEEIGLVLVA